MSIIPYIDRPGRPLDPAIALLGNERNGVAIDFVSRRAYVRDRLTPGNFFLGAPADLLTFQRLSSGTYFDSSGVMQSAANNAMRYDHDPLTGEPLGVLNEMARTNKTTCRKHNPTDTTNISASAPSRLSVVNDAAELAAAGLGAICTNGMVYKYDNTGGSSGYVIFGGAVNNTNAHSLSVWWRGTGNAHLPRLDGDSISTPEALPARYSRVVSRNLTPDATTRRMIVHVVANAVIYLILPQLEEGAWETSTIPGDTLAAVTRAAELIALSLPFAMTPAGTVIVNIQGLPGVPILPYANLDNGTMTTPPYIRMGVEYSIARSYFFFPGMAAAWSLGKYDVAFAPTNRSLIAFGWQGSTAKVTGNGLAVSTGTLPDGDAAAQSFTRCVIGQGAWFNQHGNWVRSIRLIPRLLSDAEMMQETTL